MKIILIGATGMLGRDLTAYCELLGWSVVGFGSGTLDITIPQMIDSALMPHHDADFVINCAAFTAVDDAETKREAAYNVNAKGAANIALWCSKHHIPLVHYSTDYVFDGLSQDPYSETEAFRPLNHYGNSKLAGELAIQMLAKQHYILRVQWLYGTHGPNFIRSMTQLAQQRPELSIVSDQWGAPTSTKEIARMTCELLEKNADWGTYHMAAAGYTNWYEYARKIVIFKNLFCSIKAIASEAYPRPAVRPKNSRLNCSKLREIGIAPKHWEEVLKTYIIPEL